MKRLIKIIDFIFICFFTAELSAGPAKAHWPSINTNTALSLGVNKGSAGALPGNRHVGEGTAHNCAEKIKVTANSSAVKNKGTV